MKKKQKAQESFSVRRAFGFIQEEAPAVNFEQSVCHLSPSGCIQIENPGKVLSRTVVCEIPFWFYIKSCKLVAKGNDSSSSFCSHQA